MDIKDCHDDSCRRLRVTHSMLSGMHDLTRLELGNCLPEPNILAGKTSFKA
jgi:hypothetical protein